jgi:hypothetical protein
VIPSPRKAESEKTGRDAAVEHAPAARAAAKPDTRGYHVGLFKKMRELGGGVSKELLENGLLGRGIITGIQRTGVSTGSEMDPSHVCIFTVEVSLDNTPRYTATCRQAVRATTMPQLMSGEVTVAVRVNPNDHNEIALDLATEPPTVTMSAESGDENVGSASQILEQGVPCRAVIVQTQPLGKKNPKGIDMHAFLLTIMAEGRPPYQTQVGMPVPAEAVPLLYPGSTVPAKRLADGQDHDVVIDWQAALLQVEHGAAAQPGAPA